jgi:hypothetical protein
MSPAVKNPSCSAPRTRTGTRTRRGRAQITSVSRNIGYDSSWSRPRTSSTSAWGVVSVKNNSRTSAEELTSGLRLSSRFVFNHWRGWRAARRAAGRSMPPGGTEAISTAPGAG